MADTKISALASKATPVGADSFVIVDSADGTNKKVTAATLPISTATQNEIDTKEDAGVMSGVISVIKSATNLADPAQATFTRTTKFGDPIA